MCKACDPKTAPGKSSINLAPGVTICDAALQQAKEKINAQNNTYDKSFADDYAKIICILSHEDYIMSQLSLLNEAIPNRPQESAETDWIRLSSILSYYEKKCWLHEDVLLPLGFLSPNVFLYYIKRGYVLKDYGAGVRHGEFTHRLQWFVLSSIITSAFSKPFNSEFWSHSTFELYTSMGRGVSPLWGFFVDLDMNYFGRQNVFSYPDYFHKWLLNQSASLGNLHKLVERRVKKRQAEFAESIQAFLLKDKKDSVIQLHHELEKFLSADPNDADSAFHSFDRFLELEGAFFSEYLTPKFGEQAPKVFFGVRDSKAPDYAKTKQQPPPTTRPGHRTQGYTKILPGNVYSLTGQGIEDEDKTKTRAQNSRGSLQ